MDKPTVVQSAPIGVATIPADGRYSHDCLPIVGAIVLNPNGRPYRVVRVYGSHNVACRKVNGKELKNYQANDLRVFREESR